MRANHSLLEDSGRHAAGIGPPRHPGPFLALTRYNHHHHRTELELAARLGFLRAERRATLEVMREPTADDALFELADKLVADLEFLLAIDLSPRGRKLAQELKASATKIMLALSPHAEA